MPRESVKSPRTTRAGLVLLNVGCGQRFSPEWNNLDLEASEHVAAWDVRRGLPYESGSFDGVYASHVLEHFALRDAAPFVREMARVLKPGGVCRLVVPDLERLCRGYLEALEKVRSADEPGTRLLHEWTVTAMVDQMVRDRSGGHMGRLLVERRFDPVWLRQSFGDEFAPYVGLEKQGDRPRRRSTPLESCRHRLLDFWALFCPWAKHPQASGEAHKWMWDGVSLARLMTESGLSQAAETSFDASRMRGWDRYHLDRSIHGEGSAKPDSIYLEGFKPRDTGAVS